jgi:hypothetical protein
MRVSIIALLEQGGDGQVDGGPPSSSWNFGIDLIPHRRDNHLEHASQAVIAPETAFVERCPGKRFPFLTGRVDIPSLGLGPVIRLNSTLSLEMLRGSRGSRPSETQNPQNPSHSPWPIRSHQKPGGTVQYVCRRCDAEPFLE